MLETQPFSLPILSKHQQSKMLAYAETALINQQKMTTRTGRNIAHYTLKKKRRHTRMDHYPKGDRIDHGTGAQFFYHCHRENIEINEHGHFHCFLRYKHIPKRIKPTPLDDWDKNIDNPMTHIVAIALDRYGQPIRLFTVNRWISCEVWYDAKHIPNFIKRFKLTLSDDPYWQILDQWVEAMLHLFSPQISWLHHQRDAFIERLKVNSPGDNVYENREFEELSEIKIDLKNQIQWILGTP